MNIFKNLSLAFWKWTRGKYRPKHIQIAEFFDYCWFRSNLLIILIFIILINIQGTKAAFFVVSGGQVCLGMANMVQKLVLLSCWRNFIIGFWWKWRKVTFDTVAYYLAQAHVWEIFSLNQLVRSLILSKFKTSILT